MFYQVEDIMIHQTLWYKRVISVERVFGHLDQKLRFCQNITTPAIDASVMFGVN
jgi:hypothetical protein